MKKILYADDEETLLMAYKKLLSGPDLIVEIAQNSSMAKELLKQDLFNAVIVDLRMAGLASMDGFELIAYAKQYQPLCPIFVMTAYGDETIRENVFRAGATHFIEKPVSVQSLRVLLNKAGL